MTIAISPNIFCIMRSYAYRAKHVDKYSNGRDIIQFSAWKSEHESFPPKEVVYKAKIIQKSAEHIVRKSSRNKSLVTKNLVMEFTTPPPDSH